MYTRFTREEIAQQELAAKKNQAMLFCGSDISKEKADSKPIKTRIKYIHKFSFNTQSYMLWSVDGLAYILNMNQFSRQGPIHSVFHYTPDQVLDDPSLIRKSLSKTCKKFEGTDQLDLWMAVPENERPGWVREQMA